MIKRQPCNQRLNIMELLVDVVFDEHVAVAFKSRLTVAGRSMFPPASMPVIRDGNEDDHSKLVDHLPEQLLDLIATFL